MPNNEYGINPETGLPDINNRVVLIASPATRTVYYHPFNTENEADSNALHNLLCQVNPPDNYLAQFTNDMSAPRNMADALNGQYWEF